MKEESKKAIGPYRGNNQKLAELAVRSDEQKTMASFNAAKLRIEILKCQALLLRHRRRVLGEFRRRWMTSSGASHLGAEFDAMEQDMLELEQKVISSIRRQESILAEVVVPATLPPVKVKESPAN